jgi:hypothetical protein
MELLVFHIWHQAIGGYTGARERADIGWKIGSKTQATATSKAGSECRIALPAEK